MSFFGQFNGNRVVREGIELDKLEFHKLDEFIGGVIIVDGYFFTNGKYGKQVVVVGNEAKINMPKYAMERFERIDENEEAKKRILNGELALIDIEPLETSNGNTVAFTMTDVSELPKE